MPLVVKDTLLAFAVNDKPHLYIRQSSNGLGRGDVQPNVWFESRLASQGSRRKVHEDTEPQ